MAAVLPGVDVARPDSSNEALCEYGRTGDRLPGRVGSGGGGGGGGSR